MLFHVGLLHLFCLEVLAKIAPVDLEAYVGVDVAGVSVFVDDDRDFSGRDMFRCWCWFWALLVGGSGESIDIDVAFCVSREFFVFLPFVLVCIDPLGFEGSL